VPRTGGSRVPTNEAGELNKAQEVLGVVLPADEDSALPLDPGEEALNEPAAHIAG
jgi:hypothetical protein